jgi:hypothetical protein
MTYERDAEPGTSATGECEPEATEHTWRRARRDTMTTIRHNISNGTYEAVCAVCDETYLPHEPTDPHAYRDDGVYCGGESLPYDICGHFPEGGFCNVCEYDNP